jgi:hypothetical protein
MDKAAKKPPKGPSGHKWKGPLPKGWTDASRMKFWDTLTSGAPKHKVTECIKKMEGKVSNPGAFCASLADRSIPGWREEAAKERRKKKKAVIAKVLTELEKEYGYEPGQDGRGLLQMRYDYDQIPRRPTKDKPRSMIPGKDQLSLDPSDPLYREKVGKLHDPLAPLDEDKEKRGIYDEDEDEDKEHSQVPGTDNMTMEEDHRVASQWITYAQMEKLCPTRAARMKTAGVTRVSRKALARAILVRQRFRHLQAERR